MSNTEWLIVALIAVAMAIAAYAGSLYARKRRLRARLDDLEGNEQ